MTDLQSTDGSLFSRETDDEKSFGSKEDPNILSLLNAVRQERDDPGNNKNKNKNNNKNDNENDQSDYDNKSDRRSVERSGADDNNRKFGENRDDDDDNEKSEDENDKGNASDNTSVTKKENKTKQNKIPRRKNLNENTLMALEKYLKSGDFFNDTLEYEEVAAFASKIHRYTIERTRGRQGVLFHDGNIHAGDYKGKIDPIIITEEDAVQERLYNQIYQKEEFHAVAKDFSKRVAVGALNMADPNSWHTKTSNWLKRAAGMRRQYDPYEKGDNQHFQQHGPTHSDDTDEGEGEICGGGGESTPKRVTRRRVQMTLKKRRKERVGKETESFRILSEVALELAKRPKPGLIEDNEMTGAIPDAIDGRAVQFFPTLESTGLTQIHRQSLSLPIDVERNPDTGFEIEEEVGSRDNSFEGAVLPPAIARLGLEFRPERLKLVKVQKTQQMSSNRSRDITATNRLYARKSKALLNVLSNRRARNWAIHEFFYNDLDREWYQSDGFIADLNKLGLPINSKTLLTRQEWSLVRQKIRSRPRLFSKRFIAEELKKRNRHRALVRRLQQDPVVPEFSPISVGTNVTAYHKKGSTIGKGRVLLHDPKTHCYLVQFNDKELGCEVCPDSEVAVSFTSTSEKEARPPLYKPCKTFSSAASSNDNETQFVVANDVAGDGCGGEIERELFNSLLALVTEAFDKKNTILQALEACSAVEEGSPSKRTAWLLANLNGINVTLEAALIHLQALYGSLYGSPVSNTEAPKVEVEKMKLTAEIPKTKEFQDILASLEFISEKIGELAWPSSSRKIGSSNELLRSNLSGSTKLLLLANYLAETSKSLSASRTDETTYSNAINAALKSTFDAYASHCLPSTSEKFLVGKRLEHESQIERELKDLGLAVGMLRAEVTIATDQSRAFELNSAML